MLILILIGDEATGTLPGQSVVWLNNDFYSIIKVVQGSAEFYDLMQSKL